MATTAALLQVQVDAETGKATLALKKLDKQLAGIDKTTATATTRTSSLGKASGRASSAFKSAARTAGTAALAYLSISQAKTAVTVTQDLAKTTAGLHRNFALSTKRASQWGTVAKAREIDTKALTMSFTTLSRRIVDARKGSESAIDTFKDIGITAKDLKSTQGDFNEQLLLTANAFGDAEGGAQRQQAAQKLLGRGYQTILPLFTEGAKSLREQQHWADEYGTTLNQKTLKAQMDLVTAQRESKVAWMGLQITFAKFLTPALKTANEEFQAIAKIMGDKKLTNAEKFKKVGDIIAKWAMKAKDAFIEILPKLVEAAGKAAPEVAGAFIKGFMNAPILGQFLIGAWLLGKMPRLGTMAGTRFGNAFGGSASAAIQVAMAGVAGFFFGKEVVAPMFKESAWEKLREQLGLTEDSMKKVVKFLNANPGVGIPEAVEQALNPLHDAKLAAADMEHGWTKNMREIAGVTKKELDRITDLMEEKPKKGVEALDRAMDRMKASIRDAMKDGRVSTQKGMAQIHSILIDQLGNYGISHGGAQKIIKARQDGGQGGFQRGGMIPGVGSGDRVPVMAEPGEGFINKRAVMALGGTGAINAINSMVPRFARGGTVGGGLNFALGPYDIPPIQYAADHAGGNSHVHVTGTTTSWVVALGRKLQSMGFMVGEHPAFGGVTAQHSATGGHYDALAIDINSAADETRAEVGKIASLLGGAGGFAAAALKLKLPRFDSPFSMFTPHAAGLNQQARGLEKIIGRRVGQAPTGVAPSGGGAFSKSELMSLWKRTGPGGSANLMAAIALAESGGNPSVTNSIGARGLWQIIPSTAAAFGLNYGNLTDPVANARGAHAILAGQGLSAWEAYTNGAYAQYMAKGGVAEKSSSFTGGGGKFGAFATGRLKDRLQKIIHKIARTDEDIQIAQSLAGLERSPAGTELSAGEKSQQIRLHEHLLSQLQRQKHIASMGLRIAGQTKKDPSMWRESLQEVAGLTGRGGRIFDTKLALAELHSTALGGAGGISIEDLLRIAEGARLGLGPGIGPSFGGGGTVPGPVGQPRTVVAHGGETIGYPEVRVYIGDKELTDIVRVEVDGRDRKTNLRSRAGVL